MAINVPPSRFRELSVPIDESSSPVPAITSNHNLRPKSLGLRHHVLFNATSVIISSLFALILVACGQATPQVAPTPTPIPLAAPTASPRPPVIALPPVPPLTDAGFKLITEFEGWAGRPELPDLRYSGVSWGYGYDAHQNSKANIVADWDGLPKPQPDRLAATQPFYGKSAIQANRDVHDILIPHSVGDDVFVRVDMSRVYDQCRRAMPGFDDLRPSAQSALASLIFNRGAGMSGANRVEMRAIRDLVPARDYEGMANQLRKMIHVWDGTEIYAGMKRRRYAEAELLLTP